jgi:hypothetical protein
VSLLKFLKVAHSYLKFTLKQTVVAEQFLFRLGLVSINWLYNFFPANAGDREDKTQTFSESDISPAT